VTPDAPFLIRLSQFLAQRGVPSEPVLGAIIAGGTSNVLLAVSTRSPRIDVQLRYTADGLTAVAPAVVAPEIPPRALLRIITEGVRLGAALVVVGEIPPDAAVDELMPGSTAWHAIIDAMPTGGVVNNRTRYLTEARAAIAIEYPARDAPADAALVGAIDALAVRVGLTAAQRATFPKLHPMFGAGVALTVSTECTPTGPTSHLELRYSSTSWDLPIDLTAAIADVATTRAVAATLGQIAGELGVDELLGVDLVFDAADLPEIVCWMRAPA
jgi:hypothetical protein